MTFKPLILALGLVLASCATTDGQSKSDRVSELLADARVGERVDSVCFTRGIDNFSNPTRESVVVRRGVSDEYLLLLDSCPYLNQAQRLSIDSTTSCLREFDRIQVFDTAFGTNLSPIARNSCVVDEIYRWNDDVQETEDEGEMPEEEDA